TAMHPFSQLGRRHGSLQTEVGLSPMRRCSRTVLILAGAEVMRSTRAQFPAVNRVPHVRVLIQVERLIQIVYRAPCLKRPESNEIHVLASFYRRSNSLKNRVHRLGGISLGKAHSSGEDTSYILFIQRRPRNTCTTLRLTAIPASTRRSLKRNARQNVK